MDYFSCDLGFLRLPLPKDSIVHPKSTCLGQDNDCQQFRHTQLKTHVAGFGHDPEWSTHVVMVPMPRWSRRWNRVTEVRRPDRIRINAMV